MANQERNGRNVAVPDENRPSWRPQDEQGQRNRRYMNEDDDRLEDDRFMARDRYWEDREDRMTERVGHTGYGAGRYEDRSYPSRNMGYPRGYDERPRERGFDERFSQARGGSSWGERMERGGGMERGPYDRSFDRSDHDRGLDRERSFDRGEHGMYGENQSGRYRNNQAGMYGQSGYGGMSRNNQGGMYGRNLGGMYGSSGDDRMQRGMQSHRGKGPSGYQRSDERIYEMVCEVLSEDHDVDATHIEVTVKNGEVVLAGTVGDRRQKRIAEDVVEHVAGVKDVQNQLRVRDRDGANKESELSTGSDKRHRA